MLEKRRPVFTNRGISHLVVECKVPFLQVIETFPKEHSSPEIQTELAHLRKHLDNNEAWINIYYFHKRAQYIEWDLFDEQNYIKHLDVDQLRSFSFAVFERIVKDGRIPLENVLRFYGIPESMITSGRVDNHVMREVFNQLKS